MNQVGQRTKYMELLAAVASVVLIPIEVPVAVAVIVTVIVIIVVIELAMIGPQVEVTSS